jgi:hypothetical protein
MKRKLELCLLTILTLLLIAGAFPIAHAKTITVDGNPSDWTGTPPITDNNWTISDFEYIWRDEMGDDAGNGSWVYPTGYVGGEADLLELRITWDVDYLYLLFKVANMTEGQWNRTAIDTVIDTDQVDGSGQKWLGGNSDMWANTQAYHEWDILVAAENIAVRDSNVTGDWPIVANLTYPVAHPMLFGQNATYSCIEVGVPLVAIGSPEGKTWRFISIIGVQNDHAVWGNNTFAEVFFEGNETNPSGGINEWYDPDAFDAAFYPTKVDQEMEFSIFSLAEQATVSHWADVEMNVIPEFPTLWLLPATFLIATALVLAIKKFRKY